MGSREFERRFASGLTALRHSKLVAGVSGRSFVYDPLGNAFDLPDGWGLRDLREVSDTADGCILNGHTNDVNDAFRRLSDVPLLLATISAPT